MSDMEMRLNSSKDTSWENQHDDNERFRAHITEEKY